MQVNRCNSFLEHLVMIQMEQRAAAYDLSGQLQHLERSLQCLKKLSLVHHSLTEGNPDEVNALTSQESLFRYMWQQKVIFCNPRFVVVGNWFCGFLFISLLYFFLNLLCINACRNFLIPSALC